MALWHDRIWQVCGLVGAIVCLSHPALAQVVEDNTLGANNSQVVRNVQIRGVDSDRVEGGARRGQNLFHSFQQFSVQEGRGAYFLNPDGVRNIFSRVTGGGRSDIFGRLGVISSDNATLGTANLFLINPNGIVFGQNATLDLGGSFIGTTANGLQFGDRGFFNATNPEAPSDLLIVNPSAFLFSQIPVGNIANSSIAATGFTTPSQRPVLGLRVADGQNLLLLGGDISMDGGRLNALEGNIELGGLAETGSVGLDTTGNTFRLNFPTGRLLSNLTLANDARVSTRGVGSGDIIVNANIFTATAGGRLVNGVEGAGNGGNISVNSNEFNISGIGLNGSQSGVTSEVIAGGSGNLGNININSRSFSASDGAAVFNILRPDAVGNAGNITISTGQLSVRGGAQVTASTFGNGRAGDVNVTADSIDLIGRSTDGQFPSGIGSESAIGATGDAGDVIVSARQLNIRDGAILSATTFGQGKGGNLSVTVRDLTELSGYGTASNGQIFGSSILATTVGSRNAGTLTLRTGHLNIKDGAQISASTFGTGRAGNVNVTADSIDLEGGTADGSSVSQIGSESAVNAAGAAGNVTVSTRQLRIQEGANISTSTRGAGAGGRLDVTARESTELLGTITNTATGGIFGSGLFSNASDIGNADSLTLNTGRLTIRNGAVVNTSTSGSGHGGTLTVNADSIELTGGIVSGQFGSGIGSESASGATGAAGNVTLSTRQLKIQGGATVNTSTFSSGRGGDLVLNADTIEIIGRSANGLVPSGLGSESAIGATGDAGDVIVSARQLNIRDGATLSATTFGQGKGGNLNVTVRDLTDLSGSRTASNGQISSSGIFATTGGGRNAGSLTLNTGRLNIRDGAQINASTFGAGRAGNVNVTADSIALAGRTTNGQLPSAIGSESNFGATGRAGDVTVSTQQLSIRNGALMSTSTFGGGRGGDLTVNADTIELTGGTVDGQFASQIGSESAAGATGSAGNITISTRQLRIQEGANISTSTRGAGAGGRLNVTARESTTLSGTIPNTATGVIGGSGLFSATLGSGNAGSLTFNTGRLTIRNGAVVNTSTFSSGHGGNLTVNADSIKLTGRSANGLSPSGLGSESNVEATGDAGNVSVSARQLNIRDGATLSASTFGSGRGGNLHVTVQATTELLGFSQSANGQVFNSGLFTATQGSGRAGNLSLETGRLNLYRQGAISASTSGNGDAGNVEVNSHNSIALNRGYILSTVTPGATGDAGNINVQTRSLSARNGSQVSTSVFRQQFQQDNLVAGGRGNGGNVHVTAPDSITLSGTDRNGFSSGILALSERGAFGRAGNIKIETGNLRVDNGAIVTAATFNPGGIGGDITIDARNLEVLNGGQILTNTRSTRNAGSIVLNVADTLTFSGIDSTFDERRANVRQRLELSNPGHDRPRDVIVNEGEASGLFASTDSSTENRSVGNRSVGNRSAGNGGRISVNATTLNLNDGARISAQSQGSGRAGNITLNASRQLNATDSAIATSAFSSDEAGGNITLNGNALTVLQNSDINTNSNSGNGGNITLRGNTVALGDSDLLARSRDRQGGRISFGNFFGENYHPHAAAPFNNNDRVDVNADGGIESGEISLNDTRFIQNSLNELSVDSIDTGTLLSNSCIVRDRQQGSFRITGTDNFPDRPGNANSSPYPTGTIRSIPANESPHSQTNRPWQIGDAIVEPQGVYRLPDGRLVMSRECSQSNLETELK